MIFLVIFIFGAVILGAGVMLSPAWVTKQPRIALAGTLALALIIGGAVFWAYLVGWDTLVVDYMLFALVVGIFLGGTLSVGQTRAEKRGEVLLDEEQGWTGPEDLLFFGVIALLFIVPVVVFSVPFGNPLYAYMAVSAKLGGTFHTFAPFEPGATYAYPPGFSAITAYLSQQLNISVQTAQAGVGAVVGFMCVWLIYDFGAEVRDKRLGRAMAVAMLLGLGLLNTYFRAEFPALLGILFSLAFLIYAYRYHREGHIADLVGAGLLIGATSLVHERVLQVTAIGYGLWLILSIFGSERAPLQRLGMMAVAVPLIALIATAPYLLGTRGENLPEFASALYNSHIASVGDILTYHGVFIAVFALVGLVLGLRERQQISLMALSLLLAALVLFGLNGTSDLLILPLSMLGGVGVLYVWENLVLSRYPTLKQSRLAAWGVVGVAVLLWAGTSALFLRPEQLSTSPFSSDELAALDWYRRSSEPDTMMLAAEQEDYWFPILTERSVLFTPYTSYFHNSLPEGTPMRGPIPWSDYILYRGEGEDTAANDPDMELVFQSGDVRVYQLKEDES